MSYTNLVFSISLIGYAAALVVSLVRMCSKLKITRSHVTIITICAAAFHGLLLILAFIPDWAVHLTVWDSVGVAAVITVAVTLLLDREHSGQPIAMVALIYAMGTVAVFPLMHRNEFNTVPDLELAAHLIASASAFSLLALATIQATIAMAMEHKLRGHASIDLIQRLPPLESMEHTTFVLIWTGVIILTVTILSGFMFLSDRDFGPLDRFHSIFSVVAWFLYVGLLAGRWRFGWRGLAATRLALLAFAMLIGGYFGAKLLLLAVS